MLREAQALARLSHPNVVQVYEVGSHAEQVYVAMEFIKGQTLRERFKEARAREQPIPWRELVDLCRQAGEGLAAAHSAGLIHRDFKPDNVLVGDDGRVRVLDFGLARAEADAELQGPAAEDPLVRSISGSQSTGLSTQLTSHGAVVGTPWYMSLEQLKNAPLDARSDQFSYCVTLYEGLYNKHPFRGNETGMMALSIKNGWVHDPPPGSGVPLWIRRVVLRGLSADPEGRWPSMDALLDQLTRDPRKGLVRGLQLGGLTLAGAGLLYAATVERETGPCVDPSARLHGVWDDEREAAIHGALSGFTVVHATETATRVRDLVNGHATEWIAVHTRACDAHARGERTENMLELQIACLDQRRVELDEQLSVLQEPDEDTLKEAVRAVAGLPSLARCEDLDALRAPVAPPADDQREAVKDLRRQLARAEALDRAGDYPGAKEKIEPAIAEARALGYDPLLAEMLLRGGLIRRHAGDYEESEATLAEAQWTAYRAGADGLVARVSPSLISVISTNVARLAVAESMLPLARAASQRAQVGADERAALRSTEAHIDHVAGRERDALAKYREALQMVEDTHGPEHLKVADAHDSIGTTLKQLAEYKDARTHFERALEIRETALGPNHPHVASSYNRLGIVLRYLGDYPAAVERLERSLEIRRATLKPNHPFIADSLNNLGAVFMRSGEHERGLEYFQAALEVRLEAFGRDHPEIARAHSNIGGVLVYLNRLDEASASFERSIAAMERMLGKDHADLVVPLTGACSVKKRQQKFAEARACYDRLVTIVENTAGPDHPKMARAVHGLGELATAEGDHDTAHKHFARAFAIAEKAFGADHPMMLSPRQNLGVATAALGRHEEAVTILRGALELGEKTDAKKPDLAALRFDLARSLWEVGEREQALSMAKGAQQDYDALEHNEDERDAVREWLAKHAESADAAKSSG